MSSTGRGGERHPDDFYATPAWAVRSILPHLDLTGSILEPSAGDGAIVKVLLGAGVSPACIRAVELDAERAAVVPCRTECADFLGRFPAEPVYQPDLILGNPPFSLALEFIEEALRVAGGRGTVCFILRLAFLESQKRAAFHRAHPADLFVLPRRPSFTGKGVDSAAYAWFVWGPGRGGRWSLLSEVGS